MPGRPPITTTLGDLQRIRHEALGEGRPDEVLADIVCPDCGAAMRWSSVTDYPDGGIACACPARTWSMQPVTNVPRRGPPPGAGRKDGTK
jgi:hypothetical protein